MLTGDALCSQRIVKRDVVRIVGFLYAVSAVNTKKKRPPKTNEIGHFFYGRA